MACGAGKTRVALRAAERLVPGAGLVVVLTSSIALVGQLLADWRSGAAVGFEALAVCSDASAADAAVRVADLPVPVTTSAQRIADWVGRGGRRVVVRTYDSAGRIGQALIAGGICADLVVYDEAHNVAGAAGAARRQTLTDGGLPAARRLFQTATRRTYATNLSGTGRMVSMDDAGLFGPVLFRYPLARGIAEGYLDDYQVVAIMVTDAELRGLIADHRACYVLGSTRLDVRAAAAQAALAKAMAAYGVRRAISYHSRVVDARRFAATLPETLALMGHHDPVYAGHVHGGMSTDMRSRVLANLVDPPEGGAALITNCQCLREGVDIPAVDAVLFADPKDSETAIVQAIGRALRPSRPGVSSTSTIIVPIVVPDDYDETTFDAGAFTTLIRVVRALRAHDPDLGAGLDRARSATANSGAPTQQPRTAAPQLPDRIVLDVSTGTAADFLTKLQVTLIEQTTSSWWDGYAAARAFRAAHGGLTTVTSTVHDGYPLGRWIEYQRMRRNQGWLSTDRIGLLDELGIDWDPFSTAWNTNFDILAAYVAANGTYVPTTLVIDDLKIGIWLFEPAQAPQGRPASARAGSAAGRPRRHAGPAGPAVGAATGGTACVPRRQRPPQPAHR
jgi:predicted helicase